VLVVGGGITGVAAAWDAALRGLSVALVEAADLGGGTSWNSLKTIHGGLRHLQRADLAAVVGSSRERSAFLRIAPGLVRPLEFVVPAYGHGRHGREALACAMLANDLLTWRRNRGLPESHRIPRGRTLSVADVQARVPGIDARGLSGGAAWTDAQVSSNERLVVAFARAAAGRGAAIANYVEVEALLRGPDGRVAGARCRDHEGGARLDVRARVTINAAGPALAALNGSAGLAQDVPLLRSWNLVFGRAAAGDAAVGARHGGRYLFLVPWQGRTIAGTGYEPAGGPPGGARRFLAEVARAFPWAGLREADVALVHEGLVPGTPRTLWSRPLLRDHAADGVPGLVSALGVKFTGGRALAERAVDAALAAMARPPVRSRTAEQPLPGAEPVPGALEDAARAAVRDEMAVHLDDAVLRRLDIGSGGPPPPADVERVAAALAAELGWDAAARGRETARLADFYAARRL
jgi:glycerol-3-phosphate dehydrogenase